MTAKEVRAKRRAAGITADDVRKITGHSSGYMSELELGRVQPKPGELERIDQAIDRIIENRVAVARIAQERGIELVGVRL